MSEYDLDTVEKMIDTRRDYAEPVYDEEKRRGSERKGSERNFFNFIGNNKIVPLPKPK